MSYSNKQLTVKGNTGYKTNSKVGTVTFLGVSESPKAVYLNSNKADSSSWKHDSSAKTVTLTVGKALGGFTARLA
ncbi:unnamed protein product [Rhizoctonia solani]|uniref:Uncharacterized protein n=1 Tax=Rhizoctonia solani TaxID=456999 RepID=A0A8H3GSU8_9AGAM|nr:unnamed protein product [Rhizoctonia solani]